VEEFQAALESFSTDLQVEIRKVLQSIGRDIKEYARAIVPVRTGFLRSSIYYETVEWDLTVGARSLYAAFVEFGTRYMHPRPYLGPAFDTFSPMVTSLMLFAIDEAKARAGL